MEPAREIAAHADLNRGRRSVSTKMRVERDEALDLVEGPVRVAAQFDKRVMRQPTVFALNGV